jgi:hypothetical protein
VALSSLPGCAVHVTAVTASVIWVPLSLVIGVGSFDLTTSAAQPGTGLVRTEPMP